MYTLSKDVGTSSLYRLHVAGVTVGFFTSETAALEWVGDDGLVVFDY